jgi:hypothetical protein
MAIYRLLQHMALDQQDIDRLTAAYEQTLTALHLVDRSDPITHLVAKTIFEIGQSGVKDSKEISRLTVEKLSPRKET